ncbi:MAG: ABC transporter ATP-binding protein [Promethearchaeota archaeon]
MSEPVIKLENVSKRFGDFLAVNNINLEVRRGEIIGLVGPNGAGKTTTIKMIAKLLKPTSGRILLKNNKGQLQDLHKNARNLIKIGFLIDIPVFYDMTAYQLLKYFALLQNYPRSKIDGRISELLDLFRLSEWKYKKVKTFSKGMTQKLGIIQALVHDPEILILDEPQTGLDPNARIEVRQFIRKLQGLGKTIFVASHMLYEISEVCDKIALINHGSIIGFDTIDNLETILKTKELDCQVLKPILPENLGPIIQKLRKRLELYLDKNLDPNISKIPIKYYQQKQSFKIFYDGKKVSRGEILKILIKEFDSDFTVISFSQPKTSQLERIYSALITQDDDRYSFDKNNIRRRK